MADSEVPPLATWGETARAWCVGLFGLGPLLGILDAIGVIDRDHGVWLVVSVALLVAWLAAGSVWAVAEHRRRRRTGPLR